jgi:hypothetical protein
MDKKFIKSMVAAIAGLGIISSCSMMGAKDSHKCAGAKKDEAKKVESNNCGAKNGCAAAKAEVKKTDKAKTTKKTAKKVVPATPKAN